RRDFCRKQLEEVADRHPPDKMSSGIVRQNTAECRSEKFWPDIRPTFCPAARSLLISPCQATHGTQPVDVLMLVHRHILKFLESTATQRHAMAFKHLTKGAHSLGVDVENFRELRGR